MPDIFISHIEEEQSVVEEIARGLEGAGFSVWYYERDSYPGADYLDQVSNAIDGCQAVLVLISPESIVSRQIEDEVKWAREQQKHFVPVMYRISWGEFQERRIRWRMALGIAAGIAIPHDGVGAILPRIIKGLQNLGVQSPPAAMSASKKDSSLDSSLEFATKEFATNHAPTSHDKVGTTIPKPPVARTTVPSALSTSATSRGSSLESTSAAATAAAMEEPGLESAVEIALKRTRHVDASTPEKPVVIPDIITTQCPLVSETSVAQTLHEVHALSGFVKNLALSGDGAVALSDAADGLKVWDVKRGIELRAWDTYCHANGVGISRDGRVAISSDGEALYVWDVASGRKLRSGALSHLFGSRLFGMITCLALSGDGRIALSGSVDNIVRVWDAERGRELRKLGGVLSRFNSTSGIDGGVAGLALSEDGGIALSTFCSLIQVWDVSSGRELRILEGHSAGVEAVALTASGRVAISASDDKTLKVWDADTGDQLRTLEGHSKIVTSVAITPDGSWAASASHDKTLKVWDVNNGDEIGCFAASKKLLCCSIASDGKTVLAGDDKGIIHVLRVE